MYLTFRKLNNEAQSKNKFGFLVSILQCQQKLLCLFLLRLFNCSLFAKTRVDLVLIETSNLSIDQFHSQRVLVPKTFVSQLHLDNMIFVESGQQDLSQTSNITLISVVNCKLHWQPYYTLKGEKLVLQHGKSSVGLRS